MALQSPQVRAWREVSCQDSNGWRKARNNSLRTEPGYYPPTLTVHARKHDRIIRIRFTLPATVISGATRALRSETGETYDLVIVGGGISGLAAAYFHRKRILPREY